GATVSDILAAVLRAEPDWSRLPKDTPIGVRHLLRRCLKKDPNQRTHDIADARIEIEEALREPSAQLGPVARASARLLWIPAAFMTVVAATAVSLYFRGAGAASREMRLEITTPPTPNPGAVAISPDGQKI